MKRLVRPLIVLILLAGGGYYWYLGSRPVPLVLTGIVTTDDSVVSPQIAGRLTQLLVKEGDTVKAGQLLAVLDPGELRQDEAFYAANAASAGSQVRESTQALGFQQRQVDAQIRQAEANVTATESARTAMQADLDNAKLHLDRVEALVKQGVISQQDADSARTTFQVARAKLASLDTQVEAQRAAVALARTSADQVSIRRSQLDGTRGLEAAASAQRTKAGVRLAYAELHASVDGIVNVVVSRVGEVVATGQPVLSLINPDDFWVRANVEETFIDRIRIGDTVTVRLPSGEERPGTVFFRGVEAAYATQRDVSRTKRDIKTFEVRLRVDNRDRRLAIGMTAYVLLPVS